MSTDGKATGPASYFPSIEKKYGQPIAHWLDLVRGRSGMKHMELVSWLKTEHGLGHGHANAIVAYAQSEGEAAFWRKVEYLEQFGKQIGYPEVEQAGSRFHIRHY